MAEEQTNDARVQALSALIHVEEEARGAETQRDLAYVMANDVRQVLPCRHAFFFRDGDEGAPRLETASSISTPDPNAPAVRQLEQVAAAVLDDGETSGAPRALTSQDLPDALQSVASDELAPYLLVIPLTRRNGHRLGVLLLASESPWNEAHVALAEILARSLSHAWEALDKPEASRRLRAHFRRHWKRYALAVIVLLLLPIRQYVLAPAEVVPRNPNVVAAPMEGVVDEVLVEPNQRVEQGAMLFRMDDTELSNRLSVSRKALDVASAEYLRNAQEAFQCDQCRGKVPELKAVMEREEAKMEWARAQLERSRVRAPVSGVAVFADVNEWEGRPVSTGEKVMVIADPTETRLKVKLPVGDAIGMEKGTEVVFYPNVSPLSSFPATLASSAYEARTQPDQTLSFDLIAHFGGEQPPLGWRGTAKIYGDRAPLAYLILRKPLAWVRRTLGL